MLTIISPRQALKAPLAALSTVTLLLFRPRQLLHGTVILGSRLRTLRFFTESRKNSTEDSTTKEQAIPLRSPEQEQRRQGWLRELADWKTGLSGGSDIERADWIEKEIDLAEARGRAIGKIHVDNAEKLACMLGIALIAVGAVVIFKELQERLALESPKSQLEEKHRQIEEQEKQLRESSRLPSR